MIFIKLAQAEIISCLNITFPVLALITFPVYPQYIMHIPICYAHTNMLCTYQYVMHIPICYARVPVCYMRMLTLSGVTDK